MSRKKTTPIENVEATPVIEAEEVSIPVAPSKLGKVVNCSRLNVRKQPNAAAAVDRIVNAGVTLPVKETEDPAWLEVTNGYVMAMYIQIL